MTPIDSLRHQDSSNYSYSYSSDEKLIHPNPSKGVFKLVSIDVGDDISVFDGTGRMVFSAKGEAAKMKIDLTHLEKGIYRVIVRDSEKKLKINQKIMVN